MGDWYALTLAALLLMSAQRFLYKTAAEKDCDTVVTTFAFFATVAILGGVAFVATGATFRDPEFLIVVSLVNSASFTAATLAHMESLKHVPTAQAYSIIRLNVVLVVVFSVFYFDDQLSALQLSGIVLALAAMWTLTARNDDEPASGNSPRGLALVFAALFAGALASVSSKFAALQVDKFAFICLTYVFSAVFSFLLKNRIFKGGADGDMKMSVKIGIWMGLLNIGGYYSFLKALETGPLSAIATITGMHFVVAIVLSALLYGEKVSRRQAAGVALTAASVVLLRL